MERLKTLTRIGKATGEWRGYYFINRRKHNSITETERPLVGGGVHAHTHTHANIKNQDLHVTIMYSASTSLCIRLSLIRAALFFRAVLAMDFFCY
jgi:hypothetical protein